MHGEGTRNGMTVEELLFKAIFVNDFDGLRRLYDKHDLGTDVLDEHGMTPLQHAAYKGNERMVRWLLDRVSDGGASSVGRSAGRATAIVHHRPFVLVPQGADVNSGKHKYRYTALHFAALSGNPAVCRALLAAGAKSDVTNTVGRTASQMGAFVGKFVLDDGRGGTRPPSHGVPCVSPSMFPCR